MSLLEILASDDTGAIDRDVIAELAADSGDLAALHAGLEAGTLPGSPAVVAALLRSDHRAHQTSALRAFTEAHRGDAEAAAELWRRIGVERAVQLLDSDHLGETYTHLLDPLCVGLGQLLPETDGEDFATWLSALQPVVRLGRKTGTWRRDNRGNKALGLLLVALAHPDADAELAHHLARRMPARNDTAGMVSWALTDKRIPDEMLAVVAERHLWVVAAAVRVGRTDWVPAERMLTAGTGYEEVAAHVTSVCADLDRDALATAVALAEDFTGTFEALVATATALREDG